MDLPVCYTPLWVSPSDKPVDDRLVNSCQVLRYQYIYYMPLWAHMYMWMVSIKMTDNDVLRVFDSHLFHIVMCNLNHSFVIQLVLILLAKTQRGVSNYVSHFAVLRSLVVEACNDVL